MNQHTNVNGNGNGSTRAARLVLGVRTPSRRMQRTAAKVLEDLVLGEQIIAERNAEPPVRKPIGEWAEAFLLDKKIGNRTARTLDTYKADLDAFVAWGGDLSVIGPHSMRTYLGSLKERMKPISVHRHFRSLRAFTSWGVRNEMFGAERENPLRGFEMKLDYVEKSAPSRADIKAMLAACDRSKFEGRRDFALIHVLCCGLRISEACGLRWRDVRFAERQLMVHGKGSRDEFSPMDNTTAAVLKVWRGTQRPDSDDGFVFVHRDGRPLRADYGTHRVHKISRRAKTERLVGPHALRRFMATDVLTRTGDIELVRKAGRWRSYAMVQRYAKIAGVDVTRKFVAAGPMDNLRVTGG